MNFTNVKDITESKLLNSDCVEIHTGRFCNLVNKGKSYKKELQIISFDYIFR